ncbi:MAG: hypothetical protein IJU89_03930 [Alphaproteobacteria bacterium]|nr:hypothetical protein [Alphaproteobacteria bacterium]
MRKILSLVLGVLWALPVWGACYDYTSATGTVVQDGTPTPTNPIEPTFYKQGDMVLRKVGDYADSYDATTGKITRRVGVKVLDGTEDWGEINNNRGYFIRGGVIEANYTNVLGICTHYKFNVWHDNTQSMPVNAFGFNKNGSSGLTNGNITFRPDLAIYDTVEKWQQFLATQAAAGTPVTVWYPLAEETTEDWTESQYCNANEPIKIATTKYNESAFGPLNTALANAISVVDTVVSNTITQAASIATLQAQKQTRPNDIADDSEKCPAGKKCLLVEDASGVPHWYEIVETLLPAGYIQLQWIESTGTQWIDNIIKTNQNYSFEIKYKHTVSTGYQTLFAVYDGGGNGYSYGFMEGSADRGNYVYSGNSNTFTLSYDTSTIYTLYYDGINKKVYRNETEIVDFSDTTGFSGTTGVAPRLFNMINGEHHSNSFNYPFKGYAYGFKVYDDNNNLVRNLIPAKNASGVVGMYDTVSGTFFTNAGTGEFIAGDPVVE